MAKAAKKKPPKKRADKYDEKVKFDGTFEDMISISVKQSEKKSAPKKEKKWMGFVPFWNSLLKH